MRITRPAIATPNAILGIAPEERGLTIMAQYAITALWSAAAYSVPLTVLVLRNREYAILKWFAEIEEVKGAPGLDLPAVDTAAVADGYGVSSTRVGEREELREALKSAIGSKKPELIEVPVTPGMALF